MSISSFLDKGILLGYCFSIDVHHNVCKEYVSSDDIESYISDYVKKVFNRNKSRLIRNHRRDIFHHARTLEKSSYTGELEANEMEKIKEKLVSRSEYPYAWRYLSDYYETQDLISVEEMITELRELAREIESNAEDRFSVFQGRVSNWDRSNEYPEVESALDEIRQDTLEDFWICIDAHDLAERVEGHTELATTDIADFIDNGRKEMIIDATSLDDIVGIAVTIS